MYYVTLITSRGERFQGNPYADEAEARRAFDAQLVTGRFIRVELWSYAPDMPGGTMLTYKP
jgi:hypothetical protein